MTRRDRSARWARFRRAYLRKHPLCRHCEAKGLIVPADELDHVVPLHRGGSMWAKSNIQPLCKPCHESKTRRERPGKPPRMLADGTLEGYHWNGWKWERD